MLDDLAEGVLNRGVVALYKVPVHKAHCEGGFACLRVSFDLGAACNCQPVLTDGSAADDGDLSLLGRRRHCLWFGVVAVVVVCLCELRTRDCQQRMDDGFSKHMLE